MKMIAQTLGLLLIGTVVFGSAAPASASVVNERSVSAGSSPNRIAVTPDGAQAWTLTTTSNELIGYTTGANLDLIASWPLPGTDYVYANVAILPDGNRAIVSDASGDRINVINLISGEVTNPATLNGIDPKHLALSPDGSKVAIAYAGAGAPSVKVFNTSDWSYVWTWSFFNEELTALAFAPDGLHFAAAASGISTVYLVDLSSVGDFVILNTADFPSSIVYASDGSSVFVGSFVASSIQKFDANSGIELLSLSTEKSVYLAVSPDGTQLWASQPVAARVGIYETTNLSLSETLPFSGNASGIAFAELGCQAWVAQQFGGTDTVFDLDPCLSAPLPSPRPTLPDTGVSLGHALAWTTAGAGFFLGGLFLVRWVRRRMSRATQ